MIVSYAQNFEDVMLLRALKHVEKGFYIDAGANDPAIDSVTKAFYEKGWNGINIEPLSVHFSDLQRERPRDINLHSAVGPSIGEIEIWECNVRGWATADKAVIEKHSATGHTGRYLKTPMSTLTAICEQHAPQEIHFLKIDVEGFERSVLEGMDFQRFRPWIVVMEAISPNSTEKVHAQWESLLMVSGYFFVYADGINRFYLAREHEDLVAAFEYPPNFLDSFVPASQIEAETRANQAETRAIHADACTAQAETRATQAEARAAHAETCAAQAKARAVDAEARLADTETCITQAEARAAHAEACITQTEARAAHAETCAAQLEIRVAMLINSTSWRITAPMRVLMDTLRGLSSSALTSRSKMLLRHAALYVIARPKLKRAVVAALARMPAVKSSLSRIITVTPQVAVTQVPEDRIHLSPRVRHIYSDLKTAIGNNKKDNG